MHPQNRILLDTRVTIPSAVTTHPWGGGVVTAGRGWSLNFETFRDNPSLSGRLERRRVGGGDFITHPQPRPLRRAGNHVLSQDPGFKFIVCLWSQDTLCAFSKAEPRDEEGLHSLLDPGPSTGLGSSRLATEPHTLSLGAGVLVIHPQSRMIKSAVLGAQARTYGWCSQKSAWYPGMF